jgi:CheY-like chemotaxis protein
LKTLLIADDQAYVRLLVGTTLASDDYRVVEAADGNEAWEKLLTHHPEVAIMDVNMPGRTGLDLARAIRAHPELAATRVIMLSARSLPDEIEEGLKAGADVYLTKPFSPSQLVASVQQALGFE